MGDEFGFGTMNVAPVCSPAPPPLFHLNTGYDPKDDSDPNGDSPLFWAENERDRIDTSPINPIPAGRPGQGRYFAVEPGARVTAPFANPADNRFVFNGQVMQAGINMYPRGPVGPRGPFGIPNTALGQARLEQVGPSRLRVSNIGQSGQDGVLVQTGQSQFAQITIEPPPPDSAPTGARLNVQALTRLNGFVQPSVVVGIEDIGARYQLHADYTSVAARNILVKIMRNGLVLDCVPNSGPVLTIPIRTTAGCIIDPVWGMPPIEEIWTIWGFPTPVPVDIPGRPTVIADQIIFQAQGVRFQPEFTAGVELRASLLPSFDIINEQLGMFGRANRSLGGANIDAISNGVLRVSNIGGQGNAGIAVDLGLPQPSPARFLMNWRVLNPDGRPFPDGTFVQLGARGVFNNEPTSLGTLRIEDVGAVHTFTPDFRSVGSDTARVEVYRQGRLVRVEDGVPLGVVAAVPQGMWCVGGGKIFPGPNPSGPPCFITDFPGDVPIDLLRGMVIGDELRILAARPGGIVQSINEFSVVSRNVPEFIVINEQQGPLCAADFNNDRFVNSQDFFDFINAFFTGHPSADFNHDMFINSQDYFDFVNAFFQGC